MILVLNEWIFHDLLGENGLDAYAETEQFVRNLFQSDDWIVMPPEQRWKSKAYQLMTSPSSILRPVSQMFHRLLRDSNRCIIPNPGDNPKAPSGEYDWAPEEDVYLIEAFVATKADLLVTTDETLFDKIVEHGRFACRLREEFLSTYGTGG